LPADRAGERVADFRIGHTGFAQLDPLGAANALATAVKNENADLILTGLDELFTLLPRPAEQTSSMVLITGPSRTADIEQILVRGIHGPGHLVVLVVG